MRAKKICSFLMATFILLSGCNGGSPSGADSSDRMMRSSTQTEPSNIDPADEEAIKLVLAVYGGTRIPIVEEFNNAQSEYYIEIVDYSKDDTMTKESALSRINIELASGEGPDLLYLWNLGMNCATYGPKGYLEDLLPYIDRDSELRQEDFVGSLLESAKIDGKLYGTIPSFSVFTMFGPSKQVAEYQPDTFVAFLKLAQDYGGAA